MALHCLPDSTNLRFFVPPHRTYSLRLQLPVLSGRPFESSDAIPLDDVQGLVGYNALGRSRCIWQTALRYLQDFGLVVSLEFFKIVGIVRFNETFRKYPFVLLGNALVSETANIQSNLVGWRHLMRLEP